MNPIATFINIPKNASHSVQTLLGISEGDPFVIWNGCHPLGIDLKRSFEISKTFTFCFCRNPFDRLVSWYEYHRIVEKKIPDDMTFDDWTHSGFIHHWPHFKALGISPLLQVNWVKGVRLDFIGRVENFRQDAVILRTKLQQLGMRLPAVATTDIKINTTVRPHSLCEYFEKRDTLRIARAVLAEDLEYFGYSDVVPNL